ANFKPNELVTATVVASWDPEKGASFQTSGLTTEADFVEIPTPDFTGDASHGFSFLARTGGHNETLIIDNLAIGPLGSFSLESRDPKIAGDSTLTLPAALGTQTTGQLEVTNDGATQDLIIESGTLGGANPDAFTVLTEFPLTITPGGTSLIDVQFAAGDVTGNVRAILTLANNDAVEIARNRAITLIGSAYPPTDGNYTQDFDGFADGATDLGDGSIMGSSTDQAFVEGDMLKLSDVEVGSTNSSFKTPILGPNPNVTFIASFDYSLIGEGRPADGFSFNYGSIPEDPDNHGAGEEGFGNGIAVEFDTWDNGGEGADTGIGVDVSVNGVTAGMLRETVEADPADNQFFTFTPPGEPLQPKNVELTWIKSSDTSGLLTLIIDGETLYEDLETPDFEPTPDHRFAFSARTGGATETVLIDNLNIVSGSEDPNIFSRTKVDFGVVQKNAGARNIQVSVRNTGQTETLALSSGEITSGGSVFSVTGVPDSIAPGQVATINVSADPANASGLTTGILTLDSNDPSQPSIDIFLQISVPSNPDLLAHYRMDETGGSEMEDSSGNARNGSYSTFGDGTVTVNEAGLAGGRAVRFSDEGDSGAGFGQVTNFPALESMSISLWIQQDESDSGASSTLVYKGVEDEFKFVLAEFSGIGTAWIVEDSPEDPEFFQEDVFAAGASTHLVMVFDGAANSSKLFANGELVAEGDRGNGFTDEENT
ncbi:MAG: choice-of-anchor D domain-containing protein, partial [Verrucomicrobiota bacterium]